TPSFLTCRGSYPSGREPPELMWPRSKKNAWIMFFATGVWVRWTKYRDSTDSAVSISTLAPSTAAAGPARGPCIGAPLVRRRSIAGSPGSIAASLGEDGDPPGILKPLTSQG